MLTDASRSSGGGEESRFFRSFASHDDGGDGSGVVLVAIFLRFDFLPSLPRSLPLRFSTFSLLAASNCRISSAKSSLSAGSQVQSVQYYFSFCAFKFTIVAD